MPFNEMNDEEEYYGTYAKDEKVLTTLLVVVTFSVNLMRPPFA